MPHSQSYPVTAVQVKLPQPHLSYSTRSTNKLLCSGWCACVVVGLVAFAFLLGVYQFGRRTFFLEPIDPRADLVLTIKQGSLQVHPFPARLDTGIESRYFSHLPPRNLSQVVASLDALFQGYPSHPESSHRNCWLENPTEERPCFFDASWLGEVCAPLHSYGYEETDGHFSPCFVFRLEQTGDWRPRYTDHVPRAVADHYDPGFSPLHCDAKVERGPSPNITTYPPKGFSHLFFPVSRFDPDRYLLPMVAVKLHRIPRGSNLTVQCAVVTPNAFFLWNNGRAVIRFEAV